MQNKKKFSLVLVKPSHYDDDGDVYKEQKYFVTMRRDESYFLNKPREEYFTH